MRIIDKYGVQVEVPDNYRSPDGTTGYDYICYFFGSRDLKDNKPEEATIWRVDWKKIIDPENQKEKREEPFHTKWTEIRKDSFYKDTSQIHVQCHYHPDGITLKQADFYDIETGKVKERKYFHTDGTLKYVDIHDLKTGRMKERILTYREIVIH